MGNPIRWWLSTIAIGILLLILLFNLFVAFRRKNNFSSQNFVPIYLITNYAANLLPWIKVSRCTFIYLYMGALVFAWLALAWLVDELVRSQKITYRRLGIIIIIAIVFAFEYWLPFYLGVPLSPEGWKRRMLFSNWI
jgi:dolichyl-phosphate-mannose--protein O-mannosyl transferase